MNDKIRKCVVCGTEFKFCPRSCREAKPRWRFIYCGDNCHDIFNIITNIYDMQGVGAAAEQLLDCDLSNIDNFREDVRNKIDRIFDEANLSIKNDDVSNDIDDFIDDENSILEDTTDDSYFDDEFDDSKDDRVDFVSESVDE